MNIVDANVLLYAVNSDSHHHERSLAWLEGSLESREVVGMPWIVLLAFLRLSTKPALFPNPLAVPAALEQVDAWLAHPGCVVPEPTTRHAAVMGGLLREAGTGGNLVTDAHLAALAVEHGAAVVTWDRDISRFPGVRSIVPD